MSEFQRDELVPTCKKLINPTFAALQGLGGRASNREILERVILDLHLPEETIRKPHTGSLTKTELAYRLAWARTYLKQYGAIINTDRSVWSVSDEYIDQKTLDEEAVFKAMPKSHLDNIKVDPDDEMPHNPADQPQENPIKKEMADIISQLIPSTFSGLVINVFEHAGVTNIDIRSSESNEIIGWGEFSCAGILTTSLSFQILTDAREVDSSAVRSFRGSLDNDSEISVLVSKSSFTEDPKAEAADRGKRNIHLLSGNQLIEIMISLGIGIQQNIHFNIDYAYFSDLSMS